MGKKVNKLILIRHGQSEWNKQNLFTGWIDIPLSMKGIEEALAAGRLLKDEPIDLIFTSTLIRGTMTAMLLMSESRLKKTPYILHEGDEYKCFNPETEKTLLPVKCAFELNERRYGKLQGMNKEEIKKQYGEEQFKLWRRSYDVAPPEGESLKMTAQRTLPYFHGSIMPELKKGKNVLVVAHGNSLRSIIMELDHLNEEEIVKLEIPTGKPLIYTYQEGLFLK